MTRIVITGMGVVSPYGVGPHLLWTRLMAGETALRELTTFDSSHLACRVGGVIENFCSQDYLPPRLLRKIDSFSTFSLVAAQQALEDAGLSIEDLGQAVPASAPAWQQAAGGRDRVGITVGNNLGGWQFAERELRNLWHAGPHKVDPYMATAWFPAAPQGQISIRLGIKGIGRTFSTDRSSGAHAIKHAAACLLRGRAGLMFAGGTEAPFSPYAALCYETSGLMSRCAAGVPSDSYRPFDTGHDGLVAAEGAAFLILERDEDAVRRGARIYGELAAEAATHDGYHQVEPAPDGRRCAAAMSLAMERAGVGAAQVDAVFAAGSAVPAEDRAEAAAIRLALGEASASVPVCVPKSAFGNLFGAATPLDVVIALLSLEQRVLPPSRNFAQPAPGCDLDIVAGHPRQVERLDTVLVNARGYGGTNVCLVLKRWSQDTGARRVH